MKCFFNINFSQAEACERRGTDVQGGTIEGYMRGISFGFPFGFGGGMSGLNFLVNKFKRMGVIIFIGIFFALIGNVCWFIIKYLLNKNGFKTSFLSHMDDIGNFQLLINSTNDLILKKKYRKILFVLYISLILTGLTFVGLVLYMKFWM